MKLGRISRDGLDGPVARLVAVHPEKELVVDLAVAESARLESEGATAEGARHLAAALFPSSMSAAISMGDAFLQAAARADAAANDAASLAFDDIRWASPLDPPVIRDTMTFPVHMQQVAELVGPPNLQFFETPGFFKGSTGSVYGHEAEVPYPSFAENIDYELEIGIVVGRGGTDLTPEEAERCVFGLTIFNDWSLRDLQPREMGMGMGPQHCKDFAYGIGPWITTIDELPPIPELKTSVKVNGEERAIGVTEGMFWTPAQLLAYISISNKLQPGDIVGSGTVGNGSGFELGKFLEPGDTLELTVEGIGTLRNTMTKEPVQYPWWPEKQPNPFEES